MWVLWIFIVIAAILLVRWVVLSPGASGCQPETREDILKGRYARGEIDKDEYERRLSGLRR